MSIIRIRRKALGMTQAQLAEAVGASQPSVALWENGRSVPRRALLPALSAALALPESELVKIYIQEEAKPDEAGGHSDA